MRPCTDRQGAFSLIEVVVAICVTLILAGMLIPLAGKAINQQREIKTRESLKTAFEGMFGHGSINAQPEKVRRLQTLASAVHSVLERVQVMTQEGPQSAWVIATNVYLKSAQGWRLVAHHASPGTQSELIEAVEHPSVLH